MRRYSYLLLMLLFAGAALTGGCKKEEAESQADGRPFVPRIFNETVLFPESPDSVRVLNAGDTMAFTGLQYSPGGKVSVEWKVNDSAVAKGESYYFIAGKGGDFRISVEVSYAGTTISRYRDVFVIPGSYTPKSAANVVMAYVSDTASYRYVDFENVTHLAYKVATVNAAGKMDVAQGEISRKADAMVGHAHMSGVPVLLSISGALSADGWSVSQSNNFGAVITDAGKRAALVQSIKAYVAAKKMDGVDILMTDVNASTTIIYENMAATGLLLNDLRAALGSNAIITVTVSGISYSSRYPDLSAASWINVHAYEDGKHVGPGKALGQPSGYDYFVQCAENWKGRFQKSKIVMGIPAFGLRYDAVDANGNNLSWSSYKYMPYRDILAADPTASGKEYADIAEGVYFNGIPLVTDKANYIKQQGLLGAYIWTGGYDVTGPQSLTATLFNTLK